MCTYLSRPEVVASIDVMELVGGESGVGKLSVRRRLSCGANFALVAGFDLTKEEHHKEALKCIDTFKPLVVVMGAPCTGLDHWSHLRK